MKERFTLNLTETGNGINKMLNFFFYLHVLLSRPEPLLEEILVEGVPQCPHASVLLAPLARLGVQVVWVEGLGALGLNDNLENMRFWVKKGKIIFGTHVLEKK